MLARPSQIVIHIWRGRANILADHAAFAANQEILNRLLARDVDQSARLSQ